MKGIQLDTGYIKAKSKMKIGTLGFGYADGLIDYFQIIIMFVKIKKLMY